MNVEDLFAALSFGELNSLSMALDGSGDIDDLNKSKVIYYANQALTALYTRFPHKRNYVDIELQEDLKRYYLKDEFAVSNTDVANTSPRYILDSVAEPFDRRLSKIVSIYDPDAECYRNQDLLINDFGAEAAVKTLGYNGFLVNEHITGNVLTVEYQCLHPKLNFKEPDDAEEIELAPVLEEALTCRIAAKVFGSMGSEEALVKSQSYMNIYETICQRAEADDTLQTSIATSYRHDRYKDGGWE